MNAGRHVPSYAACPLRAGTGRRRSRAAPHAWVVPERRRRRPPVDGVAIGPRGGRHDKSSIARSGAVA
ncbi:hypothetical protein DID96_00140 [Burkholderia sp. Bp8963]|nr:hypothetical protein DID96_00140 [Burkholderia sp. Bp8963]